MKPVKSLIVEIKSLAQVGARFASLTYTAKGTGEVAKHRLILGVNLARAYRRDLVILKGELPKLSGIPRQSCEELIASLEESLRVGIGNNSKYTCREVYETISKGLKLHLENGELHVYGFSNGKTVLTPGATKTVKSSEKTIAKNALRKKMKSGKFRQFALSEVEGVNVNGKTITF